MSFLCTQQDEVDNKATDHLAYFIGYNWNRSHTHVQHLNYHFRTRTQRECIWHRPQWYRLNANWLAMPDKVPVPSNIKRCTKYNLVPKDLFTAPSNKFDCILYHQILQDCGRYRCNRFIICKGQEAAGNFICNLWYWKTLPKAHCSYKPNIAELKYENERTGQDAVETSYLVSYIKTRAKTQS